MVSFNPEWQEDLEKAILIEEKDLPKNPEYSFNNRTKDIGLQIGKVRVIKAEWGRSFLLGYDPKIHQAPILLEDVPDKYYASTHWYDKKPSVKTIYISQKCQNTLLPKQIIDIIREKPVSERIIGRGIEGVVFQTRLNGQDFALKKRHLTKSGEINELLEKNPVTYSMFTSLIGYEEPDFCFEFLKARYIVEKVIKKIPTKRVRLRGIENLLASEEFILSERGPEINFSNIVEVLGIPGRFSFREKNNDKLKVAREFVEKYSLSKKICESIFEEIDLITKISLFRETNRNVYASLNFNLMADNLLVESYSDDVLNLTLIDQGKDNRIIYDPGMYDLEESIVRVSLLKEVLKNIKDSEYKKFLKDNFRIVKHPYYDHEVEQIESRI